MSTTLSVCFRSHRLLWPPRSDGLTLEASIDVQFSQCRNRHDGLLLRVRLREAVSGGRARATVDQPSLDALTGAFTDIAHGYHGATGTIILNDAGDREIGDFDWIIAPVGGTFRWIKSGTWYDLGYSPPIMRLTGCLAGGR